jgi:uncharacterized membrane protein
MQAYPGFIFPLSLKKCLPREIFVFSFISTNPQAGIAGLAFGQIRTDMIMLEQQNGQNEKNRKAATGRARG